MLVTLLLAAALVVSAAAVGQAVLTLCGNRSWRWWSPTLGFGLLLALGGQITWLPERARAVAVLLVLVTVAALLLPQVRRDLREGAPDGLPLALLMLVLAAIPYLAYGRWGIIGVNVQNDAAQHLAETEYLRSLTGWIPVAALGGPLHTAEYPVGPHGLAGTLALQGVGDERGWAAVQLVVPVFAALAALGVLRAGPRAGRLAVAALVGTSYLFISFYAQGAFKETLEAMVLLAFAVALGEWLRRPEGGPVARAVPLGLLAGSSVYFLSYGGLAWPLATAGVFIGVDLLRRRRELRRVLGEYGPALLGGVLGLLLVAGPEIQRMRVFYDSFFNNEPPMGVGNLPGRLSPVKALPVWFSGDFRRSTEAEWLAYPLSALAALALLGGLLWFWRRRELAVPIALGVATLIWLYISETRNVYNAAKGLPVLAPLIAVCIGAPLLAAWGSERGRGTRRRLRTGVRVVGVVLLVAAAVSSFTVLRDGFVGLGPQSTELQALARVTGDQPTLFLGKDHFTEWMLRKSRPYSRNLLYNPFPARLRREKPDGPGEPLDVDNFPRAQLDAMRWIITPRTGFQSAVPENFREVERTRSFVLYRREGRTPPRNLVESAGAPAALLRCDTDRGERALAENAAAAVVPAPIVVPQRRWDGLPLAPGESGTLRVRLPPGRWDVSFQYANPTGLEVEGPGLRAALPPYMGRGGPFWSAGTITSDGGEVTLRATARHRTILGRLLGTPRAFTVLHFDGRRNLNRVAFTRVGGRPRMVPVEEACGRWVDWLVPKRT